MYGQPPLTARISIYFQERASNGVWVDVSAAGAQQILLAVLATSSHHNLIVAVGERLVGCGGRRGCLRSYCEALQPSACDRNDPQSQTDMAAGMMTVMPPFFSTLRCDNWQ